MTLTGGDPEGQMVYDAIVSAAAVPCKMGFTDVKIRRSKRWDETAG